jgi:SAM-dependent methyltransferase
MTGAVAGRVGRYILDGSDAEQASEIGVAQTTEEAARAGLSAAGVRAGSRALECGCGPIGALPVLADMVGPTGRVIGVDFVESTVQRARSVIAELGLDNVDVRVGDVNDPHFPALVGDPVDVAFTRCFLLHQVDPGQTLARIAQVVRPGGTVVAQEPMRSPAPRSHPELDALTSYWELLHTVVELPRPRPRSVDGLPDAARAAGLDVVRLSGFFVPLDPTRGFELHAATAAAAKDRAVDAGIATEAEIDELVGELRAAADGDYAWVTTPFFLELAARNPPGRS